MTSHPAQGAPDYFALFQSMFAPGAGNASAPMFPMLDPKELERKIAELETVLAWLKATAGMMEVSLQTMKYQQSILAGLATAPENKAEASPDMQELARMASAMNPAMWALNMMQSTATEKPAAPKARARKKTGGGR